MFETWKEVGWKYGIARVPVPARQFRERGREGVHRVVGEVGVGDVALHAVHREPARERAAPADLDRVAERFVAGGLAHHAPVDLLAARLQHLDDAPGSVHGRPFLVAGEQEGEGAAVVGMPGQEALGGRDHGGEPALHVRGPAAVEHAVADHGLERVGLPVLARTGRDHVGVAGEAQQRPAAAVDGPQVVHRAVLQALVAETEGRQAFGDHVEAAAVLGTHGRSPQQLFGQGQRG
jgi:hypothetical protein